MRPPDDTPRLTFRCWRPDDMALASALWGDPRVTRLIDARGQLDAAGVAARLAVEVAAQEAHGVQYWPVFERAGGAHVGCCGLRPRDPDGPVYELGFQLCFEHWGKGYASEAARAVVDHAFQVGRARALFAGHHPENHASRRLLLRLGFDYSHTERYAPTGLDHPSYRLVR